MKLDISYMVFKKITSKSSRVCTVDVLFSYPILSLMGFQVLESILSVITHNILRNQNDKMNTNDFITLVIQTHFIILLFCYPNFVFTLILNISKTFFPTVSKLFLKYRSIIHRWYIHFCSVVCETCC